MNKLIFLCFFILASHTSWVGAAVYLKADVSGGLNNQRMSIELSVMLARQNSWSMVMPKVDNQPFSRFFDEKHFLDFCENTLHVSAVDALPSSLDEECARQTAQQGDNTAINADRLAKMAQSGVVCLAGNTTLFDLPLILLGQKVPTCGARSRCAQHHMMWFTPETFQDIRPAFKPSEHFASHLQEQLAALRKQTGNATFVSVHARVEADWRVACAEGVPHIPGIHRVCGVGEEFLAGFLLDNGVAAGQTIVVHNRDAKGAVPVLCKRFSCIVRDDLPGESTWSEFDRGLGEFLLAAESERFFGNIYSSFSVEVASLREDSKKETIFYNPPITAEHSFRTWVD